jgi:hypothetical protein
MNAAGRIACMLRLIAVGTAERRAFVLRQVVE